MRKGLHWSAASLVGDIVVLFFSSRRRHTRFDCDWSSDVCSSDLGNVFRVANVWMLAQPYGYPSILSSYAFDCPVGNAMGPPSDAAGNTNNVTCAASFETATVGQWVCEHRDPYIRNMVRFRRVVAGTDTHHWWDDGGNALAFSRGGKGFVAISRESAALDTTDRKSTRLNSRHSQISYAAFCLKKKTKKRLQRQQHLL